MQAFKGIFYVTSWMTDQSSLSFLAEWGPGKVPEADRKFVVAITQVFDCMSNDVVVIASIPENI